MAVRQYIGARYVPKFYENPNNTADWLPNVTYEPLTIVTFGPNTYTSKKFVPASVGDPANNPEYWVVTSNYNAYLEELQEEIDELDTRTTTLEEKTRKRYIFIGDSYGHASDSGNGWIDKLITKMGLTSDDYFESGVGGSGFSVVTHSFYNLLNNLLSTMTADDKASITDLIVLGGANDYGNDVDVLKNLINTFVIFAKSELPKVHVHIGMCAGNWTDNFISIHTQRLLEGYLSGDNYSYINNIEYLFHDRSLIGSDKVHPTNTGYERLADFVYAYLNGGTYKVTYREVTDATISNGTIDVTGAKFLCNIDNEIASLSVNQTIVCTFNTAKNIGHLISVDTGISINSKLIKGNTPRGGFDYIFLKQNMVVGMFSSNDNAWHKINCSLTVFNGTLWLTNCDPLTRYQESEDVPTRAVTKLEIPEFSMSAPTLYT